MREARDGYHCQNPQTSRSQQENYLVHGTRLPAQAERAPHTDTALTETTITHTPAQSGATVVARQQATALAQSGVSTVKLTCPPAQSGVSVVTRAEAATLVQSGASTVEKLRSPRKRGAADQSIGTRKACKITQGTAFEHVVRKPNKPSISWDKPISVELTRCHVGVSNSIDRVGSILRTKHPRVDAVAQSNMGSDNRDSRDKSNQQVEQEPNSSQRAFPANLIDIIREIRKEKIPAPTAPEFVFELTSEAAEEELHDPDEKQY